MSISATNHNYPLPHHLLSKICSVFRNSLSCLSLYFSSGWIKPFTSQAQGQLTGMTFHSTAMCSRLKTCPGLSAWGKALRQAKISWKTNTRQKLVISALRLYGAKRTGWQSLYEAVFGTEVPGLHFSQGTTLVLMEMIRRMLGAADLQGPKRAVGWEGLESLLLCLLSLSHWSRLLTSSDASLDHFSKEVCNIHWFSPLCYQWPIGGQSALFQLSLMLKAQDITWGPNK